MLGSVDNGELSVQLSRRECYGSRDETNTCKVVVLTLITSCRGAGRGTRRAVSKVKAASGHFTTGGLKIEASEVAQWAVVLATKPDELISAP